MNQGVRLAPAPLIAKAEDEQPPRVATRVGVPAPGVLDQLAVHLLIAPQRN